MKTTTTITQHSVNVYFASLQHCSAGFGEIISKQNLYVIYWNKLYSQWTWDSLNRGWWHANQSWDSDNSICLPRSTHWYCIFSVRRRCYLQLTIELTIIIIINGLTYIKGITLCRRNVMHKTKFTKRKGLECNNKSSIFLELNYYHMPVVTQFSFPSRFTQFICYVNPISKSHLCGNYKAFLFLLMTML